MEVGGVMGYTVAAPSPQCTEPVSPNVELGKPLFRAYHSTTLSPPPHSTQKSVATPLAIAQFIHDLPCIAKL